MSRSLAGFLIFCLLLALATAGIVWYVGPPLAAIVIDEERRANPYYLLQLLPAAASAAVEGAPSYRSRFLTLAREDDGHLLWQGHGIDVFEGSVLLDVASIQLIEFERGADVVQMLTSSAFRTLAGEFADAPPIHHLGTPRRPDDLVDDGATVLVLYRVEDEAAARPLGVPGEGGWLAMLPRYRGSLRWDAPVSGVRGRVGWNRLLLLQFDDPAAAQAWLEDPRTATERAIAGKAVAEMVVLLAHPSELAAR